MSLRVLTQGGGGGAAATIFVKGLDESSQVSASKDGKTVKGKWTQKPNPASVGLPSGFTQLKYLESTGTQWIDTGYKPNTNTRIEISALSTDTTNDKPLFGVRTTSGTHANNAGFLCWFNPHASIPLSFAFGNTGNVTTPFALSSGVQVNLTLKNGLCSCDSETFSLTSNSFTSSYNLILFGLSTSGSVDSRKFYGNVYYAKLYESDTLVRDFVPAKRNSDGVLGLYDLVNSQFYTNNGTGEFIAGAEIPATIDSHTISVKSYGMWTVIATNGEEISMQDVLIDAAKEYEIEMLYSLLLYREGEEFEDVTGGWSADGWEFAEYTNQKKEVKNVDNISSDFSSGSGLSLIGTQSAIDTTGYTKACCLFDCAAVGTYGWGCGLLGEYSKTISAHNGASFGRGYYATGSGVVLEIDISGATKPLYFALESCVGAKWTVKKIWLE